MNDNTHASPAILLAGGQPMDFEIIRSLLAPVTGGGKAPKIAYIGAANGDRTTFFDSLNTYLLQAGAASVDFIKLAREHIDRNAAIKTLTGADVVFFSGGEVEDGINWIKRHGLTELLRELYRKGILFIGISAGAIMMGSYWVRWDTPEDDSTAELFECLGFVPAIFDTHAEDEDWIELKTALRLMGGGSQGFGLPRGGIISADSRGNLVNITNRYLTFVNDGTTIYRK